MGQNLSGSLSDAVENTGDKLTRQARNITEIATLSYENFLSCLTQINTLSKNSVDVQGRKLVFAVKKGTDTTIFWKSTIRIACVRVDATSNRIESFKLLTLNQFLKVTHTLHSQNEAASQSSQQQVDSHSVIFHDLYADHMLGESLGECCICLERKPDVILPCAHSYCLPCIEQWNVKHKTCPICREKLDSTDDSWVIYNAPGSEEINQEIQKSLLNLAS